jgi:hypothetical protein
MPEAAGEGPSHRRKSLFCYQIAAETDDWHTKTNAAKLTSF